MLRRLAAGALALLFAAPAASASTTTICTIVVDAASSKVVYEKGDCDSRTTPASTFKVVLALMGYDAGILQDAHAPVLPFHEGYPDWISAWRQPTDPAGWMKHSVLWYSQRIAETLGRDRFDGYLSRFSYGNRDSSGDPGKNNALERSWVSSSLKISPREQAVFMSSLVNRTLPVSRSAMDLTDLIIERTELESGWTVHGKTGSAYPRNADGSFDRERPWGWYVGWGKRDGRTLVFARLNQDRSRVSGAPGIRAREGLLRDFADLVR